MPAKKPPTKKQLAARRKFVAMVRARARAAKAAKRGAARKAVTRRSPARSAQSRRPAAKRQATNRRKKSVTVHKNGKVLHGAAALAVLKSRKKAVNRHKRRNSSTPAGIQELHQSFLGRPSSRSFEMTAPAGTPVHLVQLGILTRLVAKREEFKFEESERVVLAANTRGKLYIVGSPAIEPGADFGKLEKVHYIARKTHIENGRTVEYVHKFGEEGGTPPDLVSDADGSLRIKGGTYYITADGIAD